MSACAARWYYKRRKDQPRANGKFASKNLNKQKDRQPFSVVPPVERDVRNTDEFKKAVRAAESRMFERSNEIAREVLEKKREGQP
jgi:hypothetical protein